MKGTKPYWYPNTAYLVVPYLFCIHFPNLLTWYSFCAQSNLNGNYGATERVLTGISGKVTKSLSGTRMMIKPKD